VDRWWLAVDHVFVIRSAAWSIVALLSSNNHMKTPLMLLLPLIALGIHTGYATDQDKPSPASAEVATRIRFVPGGPSAKGATDFRRASWTALSPGPQKGVLWCQVAAGVGDKFPVIDKQGVKLFEVALGDGDDDHVVLEIRAKEGTKKIDLQRDKPGAVKVAGIKYDFVISLNLGGCNPRREVDDEQGDADGYTPAVRPTHTRDYWRFDPMPRNRTGPSEPLDCGSGCLLRSLGFKDPWPAVAEPARWA
jgi:hypothetical protein